MKEKLYLIICCVLCLSGAIFPFDSVAQSLFLVAGQSNAVGKGVAYGGNFYSVNNENCFEYDVVDNSLIKLKEPVGQAWNSLEQSEGSMVPAFADSYQKLSGKKVYMVTAARGGSSCNVKAELGNMGTWDISGKLFGDAVKKTSNAVKKTGLPLKGIIWLQGERDANAIIDGKLSEEEYYNSLVQLIKRFRDNYGKTLPFYIVKTGYLTDRPIKGCIAVRHAQLKASENVERVYIAYDKANLFPEKGWLVDNVHYSQDALNDIGNEVAEFIFSTEKITDKYDKVDSRIYHIDSKNGSDENSGLTPEKAWKSFENVEKTKLNPGDRLLLKRGEIFVGELEVSGKGTPERRIIVGAYGDSKKKPCIVGHDGSMYAMRVYNSDYLTVQDLEIVNTGSKPLPRRTGLRVECKDYGISNNITIDNITVRDVNGSRVKSEGGGSGIHIVNTGNEVKSCFDSLVIENCHILRCERNAIIWSGYYDRKNWFPSKHTVVRNNLIEGVPGDGIVPIGCDSTLIEYNVMRGCPDVLPAKEAAAGIWPWSCDNTIIQFNEVSDHKAPWDAQGFDSDYNCNNTIIQYNYSHDNYGGMVLICDSGKERNYSIGNNNSIIRYNISIGDGIRPKATHTGMFSPSIHIAGRVNNTLIEKNIIHSNYRGHDKVDRSIVVSTSWDGFADKTVFSHNIFYSSDKGGLYMNQSTNNGFYSNWYLGQCMPVHDDKEARTTSNVYDELVIQPDIKGYNSLRKLMSEHEVCGITFFMIDKNKIEDFFKLMEDDSGIK